MQTFTKFILNLTFVGSIVLIATLNASQLAVVGQPIPNNVDGKPPTQSGGPRFVQPREDIDRPPINRRYGLCAVAAGAAISYVSQL